MVGLTSLMIVNLFDVIAPLFLAIAVDLVAAAAGGPPAETPPLLSAFGLDVTAMSVLLTTGVYLGLQFSANAFRYPMLMFIAVPSHEIGQSIRNALTAHFMRLSMPFYDRSKSGDLMSRATNDVHAVRMMFGPGVLIGSDTIFIVTLVIAVMLSLSWQLTLIALTPLPIIAFVTNKLSHAEYNRFEAVQSDLSELTERARESYAGIRVIQAYAREAFDRNRFNFFSRRHFGKQLALAKVRSVLMPTIDLMMGLSNALILTFGGAAVVRGDLSVGSFVAFLFLTGFLSGPMVGFGWSVSLFQRGRASLRRLDALLAEPVDIYDHPNAQPLPGKGEIELRDLTFAYPQLRNDERTKALEGVSVHIRAGETLGVIGPVGSGKSSLASLLVRLYDPPAGTVFVDGVDVLDATLSSLRETVVLAPQDTFLFSDTVSRNISLSGQREVDVERFTRLAHLHNEVLDLDKGYETMLGERGVNISGGQRQRLAIARAIATEPPVLIMDDCLSAVDAKTEEAILDNLREVFDGRTGIIISHRVCAVQGADQILVLEDGRVTEQGTHKQLLNAGGYYSRIAAEQGSGGRDD
jgi:ATP-binding cassette subfamily B protein